MEVREEPGRGPAAPAAAVIVVGGDAVVGQALQLLLRGADYGVRFLPEPALSLQGSPAAGALDGARLLLLAPRLSAEGRQQILACVGASSTTTIPVLELVDDPDGARDGSGRRLPWPCRTEDLKRHIDAALLLVGQEGTGW